MILVERHIIKQLHQHWHSSINRLSFLSKNLYNAVNYICRQYFFSQGKKYSRTDLYYHVIIYYHESVYRSERKKGVCHLSMSNIKFPTKADNVVEMRLVPRTSCYDESRKISKIIQSLTACRYRYVDNYLHNTSEKVVNLLQESEIGKRVKRGMTYSV